MDKLDKKTPLEVAHLIGAEAPSMEIVQIFRVIKKFQFCGEIKDLNTEGYSKDALAALDKIKLLLQAMQNLGVKSDQVVFNLTMVRGLDYYTGVVAETFFKGKLQ